MMMMDGGGQTLFNESSLANRPQLGGPIRLAASNQQHHQQSQQANNMHLQHQQQQQQQQHYTASCLQSQILRQPHSGQQDSLPVQYITQRNLSNSYQTQQNHQQSQHQHQQHHHHHQNHHIQLQNHNQQPQQQQQQQMQIQHSTSQIVYARRQLVVGETRQHQQHQHQCQAAPVNAPPTPPGDLDNMCQPHQSQPVYLEPSDARQQTGAWVMHTVQQQQQQQQQSGAHQLAVHRDQQQQQQQQFQASQEQTISSYYYDIDDGFSDIMSAPSTPEPAMISEPMRQHHRPNYQNEQQQQRLDEVELHTNYSNYLPYSQQQSQQQHQQQPQQHAVYSLDPLQTPPAYTAAMSPDSSALSTTSSSPSDHSLYQASPPMPRNHLPAAPLGQQMGSQQQQHQAMLQHQQRQQAYQMHALPLSPVEPQQVLAPQAIKMEPMLQQQQTKLVPAVAQAAPVQQQRSSPIHLWEFLKELLGQVDSGQADASIIRWLDRQKGVFKIEDSVRVAKLWGKRKNKPKMNYDKLSRSIRQYYKKGIMKKTDRSQRLVYQFCSAYCH